MGDSVLCPDLSFREHHAQEKGISHEIEAGLYYPALLGGYPGGRRSHHCHSPTYRDLPVVSDWVCLSCFVGNREDRSND